MGGITLCQAQEEENLEHFVVRCGGYEDLRIEFGMDSKTAAEILLFIDGCDLLMSKKFLNAIWKRRKVTHRNVD